MIPSSLPELVGNTDIYLLDQILKGRYKQKDKILDAGCGSGRNMHWFLQNSFSIFGIDIDPESIQNLKYNYPQLPLNSLQICEVENLSFDADYFDHIISSAVLHFAKDESHFHSMLTEMVRVLKPGGSLFIRMASAIGIENRIHQISDGVYLIPDGTSRFLLTRKLLNGLTKDYYLSMIEPTIMVNVDDIRVMSTLLFQKYS